jgi:hypothetical protein
VSLDRNGLIRRKAGSVPGYSYSAANKDSGISWDEATFREYIKDPKAKVPGTKMIYAGLKDEEKINESFRIEAPARGAVRSERCQKIVWVFKAAVAGDVVSLLPRSWSPSAPESLNPAAAKLPSPQSWESQAKEGYAGE